jgi:hypothetical protein
MPLRGPATATMGQATPMSLSMPSEAGLGYMLCLSEGFSPGVVLPAGNLLPLNYGPILELGLDPASPFFVNFHGVLSGTGTAAPTLFVPVLPFLAGLPLYFSGFSLDVSGQQERKVTNWIRLTLVL